jgi:hypothetical protein
VNVISAETSLRVLRSYGFDRWPHVEEVLLSAAEVIDVLERTSLADVCRCFDLWIQGETVWKTCVFADTFLASDVDASKVVQFFDGERSDQLDILTDCSGRWRLKAGNRILAVGSRLKREEPESWQPPVFAVNDFMSAYRALRDLADAGEEELLRPLDAENVWKNIDLLKSTLLKRIQPEWSKPQPRSIDVLKSFRSGCEDTHEMSVARESTALDAEPDLWDEPTVAAIAKEIRNGRKLEDIRSALQLPPVSQESLLQRRPFSDEIKKAAEAGVKQTVLATQWGISSSTISRVSASLNVKFEGTGKNFRKSRTSKFVANS